MNTLNKTLIVETILSFILVLSGLIICVLDTNYVDFGLVILSKVMGISVSLTGVFHLDIEEILNSLDKNEEDDYIIYDYKSIVKTAKTIKFIYSVVIIILAVSISI